jgi:4-alpha-glucanotransferase
VSERRAGILLPLSSLRGLRDWGVGDVGDLGAFCRWLASAGQSVLQLLPIAETGAHETSPYCALSAFALDPLYVAVDAIEDFAAAGGRAALSASARDDLDAAMAASGIEHARVRRIKAEALHRAHTHFEAHEASSGSRRSRAFERFVEAERWWLDDYALFRALARHHRELPWTEWPDDQRLRDPHALAQAREALAPAIRFAAWVQWVLAEQWDEARRVAARVGVDLYGDIPFMVSGNSADVWVRQQEFRLDATIGAPPDDFCEGGQDWGLPVMRWDVMRAGNLAWWRERCRRASELYAGVRLDHVLGYYRLYERPFDDAPFFQPPDQESQRARGETLLTAAREAAGSLQLIGEDLGSVPDFVRQSLQRLRVPGFRVLRWEQDAGVFRDPRGYPELSVATSGTHDTSSLAAWWEEELTPEMRRALAAVPAFAALHDAGDRLTDAVHVALLDGLYGASSALVVVPFIDAYAGRERINVPSTVSAANWTYRLPWTVGELRGEAGAALGRRLRDLAARSARLAGRDDA